MTPPGPLLAVSSALHAPFQALPHVLDLVSSFLMPLTIDSAVCHHLTRVLQAYETSRPYTVKAMDGAAAIGQLEVLQLLHSSRTEGCSSAAFLNAAANCHLTILQWLYEFYPLIANPTEEIVKAAECGHIPILNFLLPKVRREQAEPALEAAAANGHVAVLEHLLQRPYSMRRSLLAAASNGQAQVVQFLMTRGFSDRYAYANPALVKAAEGGHCQVVELLIDKSDDYTISEALGIAASTGRQDVVTFLLERGTIEKIAIARALANSVQDDHYDVAKILLDKLKQERDIRGEESSDTTSRKMRPVNSIIDVAFNSAVDRGQLCMVKLLIDTVSGSIGDALTCAGSSHQLEVLEFILDYCETRNLKSAAYNEGVTTLAETAAWRRSIVLAELLVLKCATLNIGIALRIAVDQDDFAMLRVLLKRSNCISMKDALVKAAVTDREEMVQILLEHSSADTIEQALICVESAGRSTLSKLLLRKCNPGAYARIFDNAAEHGLVGLIQLLLSRMHGHSVRCALISAAIAGHTEVVKALIEKSDSIGLTCAFEMAVVRGRIDVVELLRTQVDPTSISFALSAGDAEVVQLLRSKRARLE